MSTATVTPTLLSLLHGIASQHKPGLTRGQPTTGVTGSSAPGQTTFANLPAFLAGLAVPNNNNNPPGTNASNAQQLASAASAVAALAGASTTPPASTTSPLCENCHLKPKYNDGSKTHSYCSRNCAAQAIAATNVNGSSTNNSGNCDFCHVRPKHPGHPYCGKACAKNAAASGGTGQTNGGTAQQNAGGRGTSTCHAPGCTKLTHVNVDGTPGDYCSLRHKTLGETLCLFCLQNGKKSNSNFCSKKCFDDAEAKGPMLLEVPVGHVTFKSVSEQFKTSWRHGTKCPEVKHIYKVLSTHASWASYNAYKASVEARGQFIASGRSAGNENRRWHGTKRECILGDPGQTQFCNSPTCRLCGIIKTSFSLNFFGKNTGWGRFGKGIYTSSTSSKSNDYSSNGTTSTLKAMLLNKVVVGKGCKLSQDDPSLTAPPTGYDSVLAEKGGSLNYDELIIYTEDAIRPSFLVMYEV